MDWVSKNETSKFLKIVSSYNEKTHVLLPTKI